MAWLRSMLLCGWSMTSLTKAQISVRNNAASPNGDQLTYRLAAEVPDFNVAPFLPPSHRKSLKIMSRAMRFAVGAAGLGLIEASTAGVNAILTGIAFNPTSAVCPKTSSHISMLDF